MRIYGTWAGNPRGIKEDTRRCVVSVWRNMLSGQCTRLRGHGENGMLCKQHAALAAKGRHLYIPEDKA